MSANSVVTRALPPGSIAVGIPARIVRRREDYATDEAGGAEAANGADAAAVAPPAERAV